jgi:cell division control protein 24
MLATEPAQGHFGHSTKVSSLHTRGRLDMSSFASPTVMPQSLQYASTSTKPSMTEIQHDHVSASVSNISPQSSPNDFPQQDDNIMNRRADMNSSLFQICLGLRMRLAEVPGFAHHIAEMEEEEAEIEDSSDPVTSMWNCLRRGYPLMTLYNALKPTVLLKVDQSRIAEAKIGKAATFKFLQACLTEQKFPANECFLITDLYGGDTTGFVKVSVDNPP